MRRKLSKKHEKAREWPQRHGADCEVCAKPKRYRKTQREKEVKKLDCPTSVFRGQSGKPF